MTRTRSTTVAGLVLAALGVLFLLEARGTIDLQPAILWPGLLISWGLTVLAGAFDDGAARR